MKKNTLLLRPTPKLIQKIIDGHKVSPPFYILSFITFVSVNNPTANKTNNDAIPNLGDEKE